MVRNDAFMDIPVLLQKYNKSVPHYTNHPRIVHFDTYFTQQENHYAGII